MARFAFETTILNLIVMLKNKFQEQRLVQSLHQLMRVYLWMNLKLGFYSPNHCNLWYGLDTSTTFFLFRIMAKTTLKSS